MDRGNDERSQLIQRTMARSIGEVADAAMQVWQPLASHLISVIGEGGFNSLYARSVSLTQAAFPWLASGDPSHSAEVRLTDLRINLKGQSTSEAKQASHLLVLTFTNILASLIGEPLTTNILKAAWDAAAEPIITGEEIPNE